MTTAWQSSIATRQAAWAAGDFHQISAQQVIVGEWLCEAAAVHAGEHVLDVAAGSGNAALAAARRHAEVTAVDFVPALLDRARLRAAAEGLRLQADIGDAQALPYAEHRFDVVLSTFGVMFASDQQRAADELLRVCRHGGRIALASWRPDGLLGEQFGIIVDFQGGPDPRPFPTRWGTEEGVHELLGRQANSITTRRRCAYASYRSIDHVLQVWTEAYGPILTLLATLTPEDKAEFKRELATLWSRYNEATDGSVLVHSSYLEAVAIRE
jgi:ubiquinone/menaquinone biosynthesis C-methylase UbiE